MHLSLIIWSYCLPFISRLAFQWFYIVKSWKNRLISANAWMTIVFTTKLVYFDVGRYLLLSAIANQLRYFSTHTMYFHQVYVQLLLTTIPGECHCTVGWNDMKSTRRVLGHSLLRLLIRSHCSLTCLLARSGAHEKEVVVYGMNASISHLFKPFFIGTNSSNLKSSQEREQGSE